MAAARGDANGFFNAANAASELGETTSAEMLYRVAIDFGISDAYLNLGEMLREHGESADALKYLVLAVEAGDSAAPAAVGLWYLGHDDYATAREWLMRSEGWAGAAVYLSRAVRILEGDGAADAVLLGASTGDLDVSVELAVSLADQCKWDDAAKVLEPLAGRDVPETLIIAARIAEHEGDLDEAERLLRDGVSQGIAGAHNNLGLLLEGRGDLAGARKQFKAGRRSGDAIAAENFKRVVKP
jgi:tetratricopeptide (TPR) repeat protein